MILNINEQECVNYQMTQVRDVIQSEAKETCHHFWVIDSASGPTSKGRCKRCGATKDFFNSFPEAPVPSHGDVLDLPEMPELELDDRSNS